MGFEVSFRVALAKAASLCRPSQIGQSHFMRLNFMPLHRFYGVCRSKFPGIIGSRQSWAPFAAVVDIGCGGVFERESLCFSAPASYAVTRGVSLRSVIIVYTKAGVSFAGSIHLPCSRIKSCNRSTASASGILNFTAVLPT